MEKGRRKMAWRTDEQRTPFFVPTINKLIKKSLGMKISNTFK
jgi:hypothetical protein